MQYLGYRNNLKFCPIIESKSIFTRHYFFYKIISCVFLVISDHSRSNHPKYDQDQYFDLSSKITKRYIFWLHMQLIHYCGFAFAIIFAICNHSAQKAERILHVCQKVLEFLRIVLFPCFFKFISFSGTNVSYKMCLQKSIS